MNIYMLFTGLIVVSNITLPGMEVVKVGDLFFHFGHEDVILPSSGILLVERESVFSSASTQLNPPWNLDRIDQVSLPLDKKYSWTNSGATSNVYILDTGVDILHPEFEGRAVWGANFADKEPSSGCMDPHGTHVAGTVGGKTFGVAKKTNIISVKVLDCQGSGSSSGVIRGIAYAINDKRKNKIINMSLGGGFSKAVNTASEQAFANGILVVAAAGNENQNACSTSPASEPSVLTVGASSITDNIAGFSNWGSCVDIIAPGVDIVSSVPKRRTQVMSGTSMAAPAVAGDAAKIMSSGKSAKDTRALILERSSNKKIKGNLNGSPNKLLFST